VATGAGILILHAADRSFEMPVGVTASSNFKDGKKSLDAFYKVTDLMGTCFSCLKTAPSERSVLTDPNYCRSDTCTECNELTMSWHASRMEQQDRKPLPWPQACSNCAQEGQVYAIPALRACTRCLPTALLRPCCKPTIYTGTVDMESTNKSMLNLHAASMLSGNILPRHVFKIILPDGTHLLKTTLRCATNWELSNQGEVINVRRQLLSLIDDHSFKERVQAMGTTRISLSGRDRQAVVTIIQSAQLGNLVAEAETITETITPEQFRPAATNSPKECNKPVDIVCVNAQTRYYINGSELRKADNHSPTRTSLIAKLDTPAALAFSQGVVFVATAKGIMAFEASPGSIAIDTGSLGQAVLDGLCNENKLDVSGLVKTGKQFLLATKEDKIKPRILPFMMDKKLKKLKVTFEPVTKIDHLKKRLEEAMVPPVDKDELKAAKSRIAAKTGGGNGHLLKCATKLENIVGLAASFDESSKTWMVFALSTTGSASENKAARSVQPPRRTAQSLLLKLNCESKNGTMLVIRVKSIKLDNNFVWKDVAAFKKATFLCASVGIFKFTGTEILQKLVIPEQKRFHFSGLEAHAEKLYFTSHCDIPNGFVGYGVLRPIGGGSLAEAVNWEVELMAGGPNKRQADCTGDGSRHSSKFRNPTKLAVYGNDVGLVVDLDRLRLTSRTNKTAEFLNCMHAVAQGWGMKKHNGDHDLPVSSLGELIPKVDNLMALVESLHQQASRTSSNGGDGCISNESRTSLQHMAQMLKRLSQQLPADFQASLHVRCFLNDLNEHIHGLIRGKFPGGMPTLLQVLMHFPDLVETTLNCLPIQASICTTGGTLITASTPHGLMSARLSARLHCPKKATTSKKAHVYSTTKGQRRTPPCSKCSPMHAQSSYWLK